MSKKYYDHENRERTEYEITVSVPSTRRVGVVEKSVHLKEGWFWCVTLPIGGYVDGHCLMKYEAESNVKKLTSLLYPDQKVTNFGVEDE